MIVTDKLSTESFHAFIDEQLTDEQYAQVEAQLDEIPEKIEEIQQCHIINERLREVFDPIVEEHIPDDLYELGLYGLEQENSQFDAESFDVEPVSYLELEEDIAAIDSLDIFPDESTNDGLIDQTGAADLELLAQTEHLSEFDIDTLRSDSSNIIPDIFDDSSAMDLEDVPGQMDPTDELLESIATLSIELEKAHQTKKAKYSEDETRADDEQFPGKIHDYFDAETLELEPLESDESLPLTDVDEMRVQPQSSASKKVLDSLTPAEEFSLEPLEDQSNDAFVRKAEISHSADSHTQFTADAKTTRPRNLRADQSNPGQSKDVGAGNEKTPLTQNDLFAKYPSVKDTGSRAFELPSAPFNAGESVKPGKLTAKESNETPEDALPEDLVAEFFAGNKGADFEVNEVVKHFAEVSVNFNEVREDHLFEDGPLANIKYKAMDLMGSANARISGIKTVFQNKKSQILNKLGGGQTITDFNKLPLSSGFGTNSQSNAIDTLDIDSFNSIAAQSFSDEPEKFAAKPVSNVQNPVRADELNFDALDSKPITARKTNVSHESDKLSGNVVADKEAGFRADKKNRHGAVTTMGIGTENLELTKKGTNHIGVSIDFDDEPESAGLINKFGETLQYYKQKIADMRSGATSSDDVAGLAGYDQGSDDNASSAFDKYKNIVADSLAGNQILRNSKATAVVSLAAGLVLGGVLVSLGSGAGNVISNERIESLAIDTHLLNSQFSKKIIADADSAIIEKLQWFSARVGRPVRLADIKIEDFEFKKVTVIPTMANFAVANIFENKAGQRMTLMAIPDVDGIFEASVTCRIPPDVDGLCVWVKDSIRYVSVANLSLSRVRSFSEEVIEKL